MEKSLSARRMTGTEELLSVMSNEEMNPETKKSNINHKELATSLYGMHLYFYHRRRRQRFSLL